LVVARLTVVGAATVVFVLVLFRDRSLGFLDGGGGSWFCLLISSPDLQLSGSLLRRCRRVGGLGFLYFGSVVVLLGPSFSLLLLLHMAFCLQGLSLLTRKGS
jgi:hypothetical protein